MLFTECTSKRPFINICEFKTSSFLVFCFFKINIFNINNITFKINRHIFFLFMYAFCLLLNILKLFGNQHKTDDCENSVCSSS